MRSNWKQAVRAPRPIIVYLFLMLRGWAGGCRDQEARLLLEECSTQALAGTSGAPVAARQHPE